MKQNENIKKKKYTEILNETLYKAMNTDNKIILLGEGINDKNAMFGITDSLYKEFGTDRVQDVPLSENGMMGVAVGAALEGFHPIFFNNRPDFLLLALDQFGNHATKYNLMSGNQCNVPLVIWAAIGQGWGSAAQHSQSLQSVFAHFPGCKVVMPTTPYDSKGLLLSALRANEPVVIIEHRLLFQQEEYVPDELYSVGFGKGIIRREGKDYTVVADSVMVHEAMIAAGILSCDGIEIEVIDVRSIKPWDKELVFTSIKKTGRLLVADADWHMCNFGAEIIATVCEEAFQYLKAPAKRVDYPDLPAPASKTLEDAYYKGHRDIVNKIKKQMQVQ